MRQRITIKFVFQNILLLTIIILFLLGLYGYLYRHESNYCEMTYMFENPVYHSIELPKSVWTDYPRYRLYSYCEGARCEAHRRKRYTGSPVLFIVGNADSHRQVRSLGSVAYRMGGQQNQLDFFSIDFNEELSALFGSVLEQQTKFITLAIKSVLSLYHGDRTVILVGNSIGGLLARAVFLEPKHAFDPKTVHLIITQATPHQAPVIHSDGYVMEFYSRVNTYWKNEWDKSLKHIVLLSLAGGDRDHLVRSDLCSLKGLTDESRSIDVLTTGVPNVWASTDHRCIVWCRQLVLTTTRALIEISQIQEPNTQATMKILKRHFYPSSEFDSAVNTTLNSTEQPTIITEAVMTIRGQLKHDYSIPLKNTKYVKVIICLRDARVYLSHHDTTVEVTNSALPIPPTYGSRKMIRFDLRNSDDYLQQFDSIIVRIEDKHSQVDIYQIEHNEQTIELSTFDSRTLHFNQTGYVKLVFPTLKHVWQVYKVYSSSGDHYEPLMHFHVPWSKEDLYNLVSLRSPSSPSIASRRPLSREMRLKLHRPFPSTIDEYASLELFLDRKVPFTLEITYSFIDILAQLVRYYIFLLPTFLFTVLCISYSMQVNDVGLRTYQTMLMWHIHLPIAALITILYRLMIVLFPSSSFATYIHSNDYYFFFLPLIYYFIALSLWALISFIVDYLIFDLIRALFYPIFYSAYHDLNNNRNMIYVAQMFMFLGLLLCAILFSGSCGHIALYLAAQFHIIWRGAINIRLREVLTTLLLFHGLLVILNLIGFIIHIRSALQQGLLPLFAMIADPSLFSAICSILVFSLRFVLDRLNMKIIQTIQPILVKHHRSAMILLGIVSQFVCSYSMYRLWTLICFVFVHATVIFFVSSHRD